MESANLNNAPETGPKLFEQLLDDVPIIDHPIIVVPRQADDDMIQETVRVLSLGDE